MSEKKKEKKKVKVKKVEQIEHKTCGQCKYYACTSDSAICLAKIRRVYENQPACPMYIKGKSELTSEDYDFIASRYLRVKRIIEELSEIQETIREFLINTIDGRKETENYTITIKTIKRKLLDTQKLKKFLKESDLLDKFVKESETKVLYVKKRETEEIREVSEP